MRSDVSSLNQSKDVRIGTLNAYRNMTELGEFGYRRTSPVPRVSIEERYMTKYNTTRINVMVTATQLKQIDGFVDSEQYLNRSEFIRHALREHITRELIVKLQLTELEQYYDSKIKEKE